MAIELLEREHGERLSAPAMPRIAVLKVEPFTIEDERRSYHLLGRDEPAPPAGYRNVITVVPRLLGGPNVDAGTRTE